MRKYKNVSGQRLVIDVIKRTIFMSPNSIMFLPVSRDVRLYVRLRQLVHVRELREELKIPMDLPKSKKAWKATKKIEISQDKQNETEIK